MRSAGILMFILAGVAVMTAPAAAWEVGHRTVTWTDPARGGRSVPTEIYYPADVAGDDVPVAEAPPGGFPVVAFGHGFLIGVGTYAWLWQGLAPAGYVVALPRTETRVRRVLLLR